MNGSTFDTIVRANGWVTNWLARIAGVALALITVVTFCDVIGRDFFHAPFAFTVELTSFAMAVIVFFANGPGWPFRIAMPIVIIACLEEIAMTALLPEWRASVSSLWHALHIKRELARK